MSWYDAFRDATSEIVGFIVHNATKYVCCSSATTQRVSNIAKSSSDIYDVKYYASLFSSCPNPSSQVHTSPTSESCARGGDCARGNILPADARSYSLPDYSEQFSFLFPIEKLLVTERRKLSVKLLLLDPDNIMCLVYFDLRGLGALLHSGNYPEV